nr:YpjK [Salmonella enterica subsp. enterica serovar Typhimurium]
MRSIWFSSCRRVSGVTTVCVVLLKTRSLFRPYPIFALSSSHCLRLFRPTAHQNSASVVINPATGRSPMPVIAIIAIVAIVIILNKTGVSDSLTALTLATVAALLTGGGAAGAASVALTPFAGVPVGIFVGIYVFAKVVRLISGKK